MKLLAALLFFGCIASCCCNSKGLTYFSKEGESSSNADGSFTFIDTLYPTKSSTKSIGKSFGSCVIVGDKAQPDSFICTVVVKLGTDQVVLVSAYEAGSPSTIATIVGGTGKYAKVTGTATFTPAGTGYFKYVYKF